MKSVISNDTERDRALAIWLAVSIAVLLLAGGFLAAGYKIGIGSQAPKMAELRIRAERAEARMTEVMVQGRIIEGD